MSRSGSPPIGLVHGYGLSGSGSNLWTRSMARALCRLGHDVHLVCQEAEPERFEFATAAFAYDAVGYPRELLAREGPYPGGCTIHRPDLAVLPVYVAPRKPSSYVVPIPNLDDDAIEEYVRRNASVLVRVASEHGVAGFCVNHVVLSSVAARRAKREAGVPYAVLPHGSAIEYVVKKDERMLAAASEALAESDIVFALNREMEGRLKDVFGHVEGLQQRTRRLPVGVDTDQFEAASRERRAALVDELIASIAALPRGRTAAQQAHLRSRLRGDLTEPELRTILREGTDYLSSAPDGDLEERLRNVDWEQTDVVVFVGRLIAAKGAPTPVVAFPEIVARHPKARLVIAGTGPQREILEVLVWALAGGHGELARMIVRIGAGLENPDGEHAPFFHAEGFFQRLEREGGWDDYVERAARHLDEDHVLFTGFMDHGPLSRLYAIADVGVFPSVVREASPLVVPEAAASGTVPIGTDFGGMGDSLRTLGEVLPEDIREILTVPHDPEHTIADIIDHVDTVLQSPGRWSGALRRAAVERYDWQTIASELASSLTDIRR